MYLKLHELKSHEVERGGRHGTSEIFIKYAEPSEPEVMIQSEAKPHKKGLHGSVQHCIKVLK